MSVVSRFRPRALRAWLRHARASSRASARGQALVVFAAVLLPLMLVVVAIIQFGFLFAAYIGTSNAAREGARSGTIYVYDNSGSHDQTWNDKARCALILAAAQQSLDSGVPGQFSGSCATAAGGGDLAISYPDSASCTNLPRRGCQMRVVLTYRQPLFVPLVGTFLQADAQNRVALTASVTMVVN
jgi:Flp pilus assembly protein TadG